MNNDIHEKIFTAIPKDCNVVGFLLEKIYNSDWSANPAFVPDHTLLEILTKDHHTEDSP